MTVRKSLTFVALSLVTAAATAAAATAAGEPKNEWPFTRAVGDRTTQAAIATPRPELPLQGEPKNEPPFVRPTTVVVVSADGGFDWVDGGIGAAAGIGVALAGAGAALVARKSPQVA
jgi:hypothetical protein